MSTLLSATSIKLADERPATRGLLHLGTAFVAVAGAVWLILLADSPTAYVGAGVFGASLILLYWTSATYHRITWTPFWRRIVKRVDHAMIFVLIAGTYTPFAMAVSPAWWIPVLSIVWSLAVVGTLVKVVWPDAPRWLGFALYVGIGWVGVVAASEVFAVYSLSPIALLLGGGALYMVGGVMYALRRPNPWPRVFGYHEFFHTFVVAGSAAHFAAIAIYVLPG